MNTLQILILLWTVIGSVYGQQYENTNAIFKDFLNSSIYNTEIIPVSDQSHTINVTVHFSLVSIVTVDDTTEAFICNGFMSFEWIDQRIRWDPVDYGGMPIIHPLPKQIWRPRVVLLNTLDKRDLFEDDYSPIFVDSNGSVEWTPGSLFSTSCSLNLLKYPFDVQLCHIEMLPMGLSASELLFIAGSMELSFYNVNGEWDVLDAGIESSLAGGKPAVLSKFKIHVRMKRRPTFYVLTIILPFVFLSFLNLMVFIIPQESGEKIGYGITVLLALSVFFSIVGGMLPRSSNVVPNVIIYLFILYVLSTLAVIVSIVIGSIYHAGEREVHRKKMRDRLKRITEKIWRQKRSVVGAQCQSANSDHVHFLRAAKPVHNGVHKTVSKKNLDTHMDTLAPPQVVKVKEFNDTSLTHESRKPETEKQECIKQAKAIANTVDFTSGIIFLTIWLTVTMWFFISVLT